LFLTPKKKRREKSIEIEEKQTQKEFIKLKNNIEYINLRIYIVRYNF